MVIGIVGTLGAGKGTVVRYLQRQGFRHYSSSGILKEILTQRGILPDRRHLSTLADELNEKYDGGVLYLSHERAQKEGAEDYVLEAIHRESEARYIRSLGGYILGIDADPKLRYERTTKRNEGNKDNVTYEEFLQSIAREEDGKGTGTPHILKVLQMADFVIQNDGTIAELERKVAAVLEEVEK